MKCLLTSSATTLLIFVAAAMSRSQEPNPPADRQSQAAWNRIVERAGVVRPTTKELAWLQIPWVLDLKAAQETAKAEGRPIFLWATGDDPLERC
jgi:hypothetical protein